MIVVRVLIVLLLLIAVPLTAVRVFGLDRDYPWVTLMTVFPYVAVVAGLATVGALLAGYRWEAGVGLVTLVACAAVLVPRELPDRVGTPEAAGPELTIAVSNLRVGRGDATTIAAAVERYEVDVLVVLELTEGSIERLIAAGLSRSLEHTEVLPSRLTSGAAIYSVHPLRRLEPSMQRRFGGGTPRVVIDVPGYGEVEVSAVHPLPPINPEWSSFWSAALRSLPGPATTTDEADLRILAGDFNATHDHREFRSLLRKGWVDAAAARGLGLRPTFSGIGFGDPVPPVTLDHVLVDERVTVEQVDLHPIPNSDHRMIVVRVRLPAP